MGDLHDRIERRLKEVICSVCVKAGPDGACTLDARESCAIFEHLDDVMRIIASTHSDTIDMFVDRLRAVVCERCVHSCAGTCKHRDHLDCALDLYFPLVTTIVEEELEHQPQT